MTEPVSRELWESERGALVERIVTLERHDEELRGAEQVHRSIEDRISALEQARRNGIASGRARRDRIWLIVVAALSSLVFPLVLGAVVTLFHLRS